MTENKTDLLSLGEKELEAFFLSIGEPKYRAKQLFTQMHRGLTPDEITNFSAATKQKIKEAAYCYFPTIARKLVSALDGTVKYLFRLSDGNCVESVVMRYEHGTTICISTQVGCLMGCRFCASTIDGKVRNLTPSELLGQIIAAAKDLGERIDGIVMMGIGEPLDNYDNVIRFLHLVGEENGVNIGYRHISLSTCGLVDKIYKLAEENFPITLSISLHAADDVTRSEIMPIHVNLIPVNEVKERDFTHSDKKAVARFAEILEKHGIRATVRRTLGADINASCGQLRRAEAQHTGDKL